MQFSEQLNAVKTLLESLESNPKVDLFSGSFQESDLDKLKFDGKRPYILTGCAGGPITEGSPRLEIEAVFGAWVIAKADQNNSSFSKVAIDTATEIAKKIKTFRGDVKTNTRLPVIRLVEELSSGGRNGSNYSIWQVVWTQTIALD